MSRLSLRQIFILGAALGITLPALILGSFWVRDRYEREVAIRVQVPMSQYADMLSDGLAVAIWNVDKEVAGKLVQAVMRNPEVVRVTVRDEYQEPFNYAESPRLPGGQILSQSREVHHGGRLVGFVTIELSTARVERELVTDLYKQGFGLLAQVIASLAMILLLFEFRLIRPLRALQAGANRLARGELDQPIATSNRHDEIGELAHDLDTMRGNLGRLIGELDGKNTALQSELEERLRAEEALRFSQAKFIAIFHASPVAMTVTQVGSSFPVSDVNDAWVRLFERSREATLNTADASADFWADPHDRARVLENVIRSGAIHRYSAWLLCGYTGKKLLCEVSGRIISFDEESLLILSYEDITSRHQNEQQIRDLNATLEQRVTERTQELAVALAKLQTAHEELVRSEKLSALGSLVAGIAHELNTPIGNSLTVASTLQDDVKDFNNSMGKGISRAALDQLIVRTRDGTDILMNSLGKAVELIASFKQVAVDQTSANRRSFDLRETVAEIVITLGPMISKTPFKVACEIPDGIMMESYPGPLGQVLTNLINNAFLHGFDGASAGQVTIAAEKLDDEQVQITVSDDGCGIPPENLNRIFDPFFTTKLGQGGSGLGLNIVYNLVTGPMGGVITVRSLPGEGTHFSMKLPLSAPGDSEVTEDPLGAQL